ncbi:glycosyltransferase, partial [Bacillus sp. JJ722]|uniref:glycosyltransferase n=1 Tax=Bacillus sp. JJ722 TaxID=3122973 RepID=UPI002FFD8FF9
KLFNNTMPIQLVVSTEKKLKGFDVAISYLHSSNDKDFYGGCNEFVLKKVATKKKIAYIHCDYLNYGGKTTKNNRIYKKFKTIAAVSVGCKDRFIQSIPDLTSKTLCVKNCQNYNEIIKKANVSPIVYNSNSFNIVTVSRLSREKGIVRTMDIIAKLIKKNYKICWHIIGEGEQKKTIEELIEFHSLEGKVILYGNQNNPYRYMINAELFLLPSYHEAAPMVFDEAKILGLPILATKTISTKEMIIDANAGWVCENSTEGIQTKLEYILNHLNELEDIREKLKLHKSNNEQALKQFDHMLERVILNG